VRDLLMIAVEDRRLELELENFVVEKSEGHSPCGTVVEESRKKGQNVNVGELRQLIFTQCTDLRTNKPSTLPVLLLLFFL